MRTSVLALVEWTRGSLSLRSGEAAVTRTVLKMRWAYKCAQASDHRREPACPQWNCTSVDRDFPTRNCAYKLQDRDDR